jgi:TPR repeat protein
MKAIAAFAISLAALCAVAHAGQPAPVVDDGVLNPEELTLNYFANSYDFKAGKSAACVYGYWATKGGNHADAVKIFDKCASANIDAAMIWMSYMYENGYAVEKNLETATEWSKRAALRGYKVGEYNYGLSLLRGLGAPRDEAAGRAWIGKAAGQGFEAAKELIDSGYDVDVAIPDADESKVW